MIPVAYIVDHLQTGGAQAHLLRVVENLDREIFAPEIWTSSAEIGELAERVEEMGVPVHSFGLRESLIRPATLAACLRVARDFRRRRIAIVHGYLFEGNFLASLTGRLAGTPLVLVAKRSLDRYDRLDRRLAAALSNRLAHRVTVNAGEVGALVREHEWCPAERLVTIPNGVELPPLLPRPPLDPVAPRIGMVGRLGWKKNYPDALAAIAAVRKQHPGLRVEIVGEGDQRDELARLRHELGLEDCVEFLGRRDDVPALLPRWDAYLLSSIIEGMPNALLEAMAAGLPVVTTDAGGSAEIVEDGVSGRVVPRGDPAALATALGDVLGAPERALALGKQAATRVREHYSLRAMIEAMETTYRDGLAQAGFKIPVASADANSDASGHAAGSLHPAAGGGA